MSQVIFNSWSQPESDDRLSVVFAGRFKEYGAYQVRSSYRRSMVLAMIIACFSVAVVTVAPLIMEKIFGSEKPDIGIKTSFTSLCDLNPPDNVKKDDYIKEPPKVQEPELIATQAYVAPRINENAASDGPAEPVFDIRTAGTRTQAGGDEPFDGSTGEPDGTGSGPVVQIQSPSVKVSIAAVYPGDIEQFVRENFEYPERCKDAGIEGYVLLKFVVDLRGEISRIEPVEQNIRCPEFTQEAIRVLKKSAPWIPAQNNGKFTIAWRQLPIKLSLGE
jgi:protein TonB